MRTGLLFAVLLGAMACASAQGLSRIGGIRYKMFEQNPEMRAIKPADLISCFLLIKAELESPKGSKDSVLFNSFATRTPFNIPQQDPSLKNLFLLLHESDSAYFELSIDTLYGLSFGAQVPAVFKPHSFLRCWIRVLKTSNEAELKRQQEEQMIQLRASDSVGFMAYVSKTPNLQQTPSGLCYVLIKPGEGPAIEEGDEATVDYKGYLLNGKVFDQHNSALFRQGQLIPGWNEAMLMMKKGSEVKLIIPYYLGYGERGTDGIPPFSSLIFDVRVLSVKKQNYIWKREKLFNNR